MTSYTGKKLSLLFLIFCLFACQNNNHKASSDNPTLSIREDISVEQAYEKIIKGIQDSNLVVIDVRTPKEYEQFRLKNTLFINYRDPNFKTEINKLDRSKTYIVYCLSGKRSGQTCDIMQEAGFKEVYNIAGGMLKWQALDLPVVRLTN